MDSIKYIGLDVHQSTISVAVVNADGKLVMQSVKGSVETALAKYFRVTDVREPVDLLKR